MMTDLVPWIDRTFRMIPNGAHRAMAGLSMGGIQMLNTALNDFSAFDYVGVFGSGGFNQSDRQWFYDNKKNLIANRNKELKVFDWGWGAVDFAKPGAVEITECLKSRGVRLTTTENQGGHDWRTWREDLHRFRPKDLPLSSLNWRRVVQELRASVRHRWRKPVRELIAAAGVIAISLAQPFKATYAEQAPTPAPTAGTPAATQYKYLETPAGKKPRIVITADPELDDNNSMIRYLLMSDGYQTEGLVYTSSQFHWQGDGKGTLFSLPNREYNRNGRNVCPCTHWRWAPNERFIDNIVDAYEKAYPNLKVHSKDYPTPVQLRSKVKWGNIDFEGEMDKDTDGSNLIKSLLLDNVNEPIYLHAWGGLSTIARALKSIEDQYKDTPQWATIRAKVIGKGVIHPSGAQDNTGANYVRPNWPEIRYGNGGGAGGAGLAYNAQSNAADADKVYYSAEWMHENISSKGDFGKLQRVWGDGKQMEKGDFTDYFGESGKTKEQLEAEGYWVWTPPHPKGEFLGEGDTGTFLSLLDNGLEGWRQENRRNPTVVQTAGATNIVPFGGGGDVAGRARGAGAAPGTQGAAAGPVPPGGGAGSGGRGAAAGPAGAARGAAAAPRPPSRFLRPLMHELAERMTWAITPKYRDANHYPTVTLKNAKPSSKPGEVVNLSVTAKDPDGDKVSVKWWRFVGNGTYAGAVTLDTTDGPTTSFRIPTDAKPGDTIHIIAEANDDGTLSLTRYARAVVTVK